MSSITANGSTQEVWIKDIGGTNSYSTDSGSNWTSIIFPATVTNTAPTTILKVLFKSDISLIDDNSYFVCGSDYIQFGSESLNSDGSRPTITIVANLVSPYIYPGLIKNSDGTTNGYNAIYVINLQMTGTGTPSLNNGGGWFGQANFGKSALANFFINCSADENLTITSVSGGIVGANAANGTNAEMQISGCSSAGPIYGFSGGIVGHYGGANNGNITVTQCSSSGDMSIGAGGIFGQYAARIGGRAYARASYSTGSMTSDATDGAGGIFGRLAGDGSVEVKATACYSTGAIGFRCGGIFGSRAFATCSATNCYSTGIIFYSSSNESGGIFGFGYELGAAATNCYTSGLAIALPGPLPNPITGGIYAGSSTDGSTNYSEARNGNSGSWSDVNAISPLTNIPSSRPGVGNAWASVLINTPFLLPYTGATPYRLRVTTDSSGNIFEVNFNGTVTVGGTTAPAVLPAGWTYALIEPPAGISINSTTGAISTTSDIATDTYTLYVYASINPYTITTYTLTVNAVPVSSAAAAAACCGTFGGQSNLDYATIFEVKGGNALIADSANPRNKFTSYADIMRFKMALAFPKS